MVYLGSMAYYGFVLSAKEAFSYYKKWVPDETINGFMSECAILTAYDITRYYSLKWKFSLDRKCVFIGCGLNIQVKEFLPISSLNTKELFNASIVEWVDEGFKLLGLDPKNAEVYVGDFRNMKICEKLQ